MHSFVEVIIHKLFSFMSFFFIKNQYQYRYSLTLSRFCFVCGFGLFFVNEGGVDVVVSRKILDFCACLSRYPVPNHTYLLEKHNEHGTVL